MQQAARPHRMRPKNAGTIAGTKKKQAGHRRWPPTLHFSDATTATPQTPDAMPRIHGHGARSCGYSGLPAGTPQTQLTSSRQPIFHALGLPGTLQ
jgi:hypothetical protein